MELGKKIVKIRKDNNLTQEDFAEKYNVTRQTVSSWENSKSYPDLETLVKISDDFNISLDVLLKEDKKVIENISNTKKESKRLKVMLIIIISIIILISGYKFTYNMTKYVKELHINKVLKNNNFIKNNDEFAYSLKYSDRVTYYASSEITINKFLFKIDLGILNCRVILDNGDILYIVWSNYDYYGVLVYNSDTMITSFNMETNDKVKDRFKTVIDNVDIDEVLFKEVIDKGNELYKQLYK